MIAAGIATDDTAHDPNQRANATGKGRPWDDAVVLRVKHGS